MNLWPAPFAEGALFPNPAHGLVNLDLVYDSNEQLVVDLMAPDGTIVKSIYQGIPRTGRNRITFDSADLTPGMYVLVARTTSSLLGSHRFIVQ
ncbi:MAG: T9SS type A sorting domain-containing protein [Flavobacteriales bacterium]|nr:T9SS type A sorting domain-containing protein [Flavobacteriales bacterium]